MDQGIIAALKCRYKSKLIEQIVNGLCQENVNLLNMMQIAKEYWQNVSAQSILFCWKKSRCLPDSFIVTINEEFAVYRK